MPDIFLHSISGCLILKSSEMFFTASPIISMFLISSYRLQKYLKEIPYRFG